ncbi:hypothetical protein BWI97_18335 [Siphonobacter sp. BAB-5405]|uniref:SIR2 family NAD-dependent protein deacylase n=1 Tax=Siphonobacter sp. BAB-5405 TaxID=1864825 RepID=UPI000C7F91D8|nr:SIR2 family protein [Siphonobacter sp. BAB-5405]PMD93551.1 hypothetical protein BWI97_18335 [Siphonobacter sp. BAB-5405]
MQDLLTKYFPKPLLEDIVKGNCLPIIGSGFSLNAIIPEGEQMLTWDGLGKKISEYLPDFASSNALDIISAYSHEFTRIKLIEKLTELLLVDQIKPGKAHAAFSKLPFKLICTTNFDYLLEQSYPFCRPILDESQLSISFHKDVVSILKFHGDFNHPNKVVATEEDYDLFLENNPLFATFIANQLIVKTPLFIGYSIDDPDFRQIFKIVSSRLGNYRRPAYTIKLNSPQHEISKFERRGIKVINVLENITYSDLFQNIFEQLDTFWNKQLISSGTFTHENTLSEVIIQDDNLNRLCYFGLPKSDLSFYKKNVFPIVEKYGLVPITLDEFITVDNNNIAKVTALIQKAEFLVFDLSSEDNNIVNELSIALLRKKKNLLIIKDKNDEIFSSYNKDFILILDLANIERPDDIYEEKDNFLDKISSWFKNKSEIYLSSFYDEPIRLLNKEEFRSAVISAFTLIDSVLRKKLESENYSRSVSSKEILYKALEKDIISQEDFHTILQVSRERNILAHSLKEISSERAKKIVDDIMKIVDNIS